MSVEDNIIATQRSIISVQDELNATNDSIIALLRLDNARLEREIKTVYRAANNYINSINTAHNRIAKELCNL